MSKGNTYKTYFVSLYKSTTTKTSEKLFFYVYAQAERVRLKMHIVLMNQENGIIFVVKIISI